MEKNLQTLHIQKKKYEKVILGMQFVGLFIVQMMSKKVILGILKS
jgi:hypothetical protein